MKDYGQHLREVVEHVASLPDCEQRAVVVRRRLAASQGERVREIHHAKRAVRGPEPSHLPEEGDHA